MKIALATVALVALIIPVSATGERAAAGKVPRGTVAAIEDARAGDYVVRVDAGSLTPRSKRLLLRGQASAPALSPDGRRLAVGVDRVHGVRIVELSRMKKVAEIQTWGRWIHALAWVSPRRIIGWEGAGLFLLDPVAKKRLRSPEVSGEILAARQAGSRLAVLVAPGGEIGAATLAVVEPDGSVRSVALERIAAGARPERDGMGGVAHDPAFVVDPAGRAYVFGAGDEPVAEVGLANLDVRYHEVKRAQSLLSRLRNWLEPAAEAKLPLSGSWRRALWLGDGRIALWGYDAVPVDAEHVQTTPVGLSVVDTADWTSRTVDDAAWHVALADETLLVSYHRGGLTAYDLGGARRYEAFEGERLGVVATFGSRAFVAFDRRPIHVVDARTGRVLSTRKTVPRLLHRSFFAW